MFNGCENLTELDLRNFDTGKVKNMQGMFEECINLVSLDISSFDTSNVTEMDWMFNECNSLTKLNLNHFKTTSVTSMNGMFRHCSSLTELEIANFDTSNVTGMNGMFNGCSALSVLDVSMFDTSEVTDMGGMFAGCSGLTELDIRKFDTADVTNMSYMFSGCSKLTDLDLLKFETSKVTNMANMFMDCSELTALEISEFDTAQVTYMVEMFRGCTSLEYLDLSSFDMGNVTKANHMFTDCNLLKTLDTPYNVSLSVNLPGAMRDENGEIYIKLPTGRSESVALTVTEMSGTMIGDFLVSDIEDQVYTGKKIQPEVTVILNGHVLEKGKDYTASYKNNTKVARVSDKYAPTVIIKGKGSYTGSISLKFNILAKEMTAENTVVEDIVLVEKNKVQYPKSATVLVDGKKLSVGKDCTLSFPDADVEGAYKKPGEYPVLVEGKGNYQGSVLGTMIILSKDQPKASALKISGISACKYEEGNPATPTPIVKYKGKTLVAGKDYALSYMNNDRAGKATLIITGLKNTEAGGTYVTGVVKKNFKITGTALKKAKVTYDKKAIYTGSKICPEVTLTIGETTLRPGKDYTVAYIKNTNVGKGTIVLTGCGGYTGIVKKTFTIQADPTVADRLTVSFVSGKAEATHVKSGAKPEIVVSLGNTILQPDKDYRAFYMYNKEVAAADDEEFPPTISIWGKGNYDFDIDVNYTILQKSLSDKDITVTVADTFVGKRNLLSVPVVKDENGQKLEAKKDYTVSYSVNGVEFDGKSQVEAGTVVTVTVEGTGKNYIGKTSTTYRVATKDISKTKLTMVTQYYNGTPVVFTEAMIKNGAIRITDKTTKKELVYGVDYIITGYRDNDKKGAAYMTIQGIGEYGGTMEKKFWILSKLF